MFLRCALVENKTFWRDLPTSCCIFIFQFPFSSRFFYGKKGKSPAGATCTFTFFLSRNPSWGTKGLGKQQWKWSVNNWPLTVVSQPTAIQNIILKVQKQFNMTLFGTTTKKHPCHFITSSLTIIVMKFFNDFNVSVMLVHSCQMNLHDCHDFKYGFNIIECHTK